MKQRTKTLSLLALALVLAAGTSAAAVSQLSSFKKVALPREAGEYGGGEYPDRGEVVDTTSTAEKTSSTSTHLPPRPEGHPSSQDEGSVDTTATATAVQSSITAISAKASQLYTRLKAQHPRLGLRTNLLSWSILSPSLGVDLQWGTRWQATIDGSIGLMSTAPQDGHARYTRISSIGLEARRYFNPNSNPLAAPHHGLYLALGIRHMHLDYKHRSSPTHIGREGTLNTAGIIMGYTITLPARLTIDAAAGAGYLHRYYNRYAWYPPAHQNRLLSRQNKGMLGLTHAEVSIVYHFKLK